MTRLPRTAMLALVLAATWASGSASAYEVCVIEYQITNEPDPATLADTDPETKEFNACVRNLEDCSMRAKTLARAHEEADFSEGVPTKPNLATLMVTGTRTEGSCDELD